MLPIHQQLQEIQATWIEATKRPSGNLASNAPLPSAIRDELFGTGSLAMSHLNAVHFLPRDWDDVPSVSQDYPGLRHIIGLQRLAKPQHVTLFRSLRFPTPQRIVEALSGKGICLNNFEQERLKVLYTTDTYVRERKRIQSSPEFEFLPQERIVKGLPVFLYANDALQIHTAFRASEREIIMLAACYIPSDLLHREQIRLYSNPPYALDAEDSSHDYHLSAFVDNTGGPQTVNLALYRRMGIEIYETYLADFPRILTPSPPTAPTVSFFIVVLQRINGLQVDKAPVTVSRLATLASEFDELYGLCGNRSSFFRRPTTYLPEMVYEITLKKGTH